MMNLPMVAFGNGFISSRVQSRNAPVYMLDPKNGMPIVKEKKHETQTSRIAGHKIKKK